MTKAALYYHFPAKQDVLEALVRPLLVGLDAITEKAHRQRPMDREQALRGVVDLFAGQDMPVTTLFSDPSALHDVAARLDMKDHFARFGCALARSRDPLDELAVRCALGAVHAGVTTVLGERKEPLTEREVTLIVEAALRAWSVADEDRVNVNSAGRRLSRRDRPGP